MSKPRLHIRKRIQLIQGKKRPTCHVQAHVPTDVQVLLEEHFVNENLFRRAAYSMTWPEGAPKIPGTLAPAMAAFLKNDACPEISVRTMLAGQTHQAANVWEMLSFELVAKVAFENLCAIVAAVSELDRDIVYPDVAAVAEARAFDSDTLAELRALTGSDIAA